MNELTDYERTTYTRLINRLRTNYIRTLN